MENQITLVQVPIIKHSIVAIGESVTERLEKLNIDNQLATEDSVKSLKELRAELNKELTNFENQRKLVKGEILKPYDEFDGLYKFHISEKYNSAISKLKDKIAIVEDKIKSEKKTNIINYFTELCTAEKIDFIKFEQLNLEINLSTTEKNYKDKINEFINKINDDLLLIHTLEDKAEIFVEYKKTLNASKSIKDVQERKEAERQEKERIRITEVNRRQAILRSMAFTFSDMLQAFTYDENIYIKISEVENSTKEDFANKIIVLEEAIKAKNALSLQAETTTETKQTIVEKPVIKTPVISAPVVEEKIETFIAKFEVEGTMKQLNSLKEFLLSNNINYKNI